MLNLTEEKKESLLHDFRSKFSAIDKLEFWIREMPISYIEVYTNSHYYPDLKDFVFYPRNEETKEFHSFIIENYERIVENNERAIKLIAVSDLQKQLEWELKKPKTDKAELLNDEIRKVDKAFVSGRQPRRGVFSFNSIVEEMPTTFTEYYPDFEVFQDYLNYEKKPNYGENFPMLFFTLIAKENGYRLAIYRKYLSTQLEKLKKGKSQVQTSNPLSTIPSTASLTVKQTALLFAYAGIKDNQKLKNISELARLFVPFLGVSYKNFYDALNYAGTKKSKTKEDLTAVLNHIKVNNLKSIQKVVEEDLKKASKEL